MLSARNEHIRLGEADFDYIVFGKGPKNLVLLPGVGDGFQTAKGLAVPFSLLLGKLGKRYRVYVFSRRNRLPEGFSTERMAQDLALVMDAIGLRHADVIGVSQGGMIAQQLAIRSPQKVDRLVLTVTAARPNPIMVETLSLWLDWAERGEYLRILSDNAKRSYTGKYLEKQLRLLPLLGAFRRPKDFTRFRILCESCLMHDVFAQLDRIVCPTLIVGGEKDGVLGADASRELGAGISGSKLYVYEAYGHGLYEQANDFYDRVLLWLDGADEGRF